MKYFPSHDTLSLLEVRTESYFLGCSVAHSFVQNVLLQLKEIGHSLVYTFQLQGAKNFDREKKLTVCRNMLLASNPRVVCLFCYC